MIKYKYADAEHRSVNDLENGIYGIHPGVYLWEEVQSWIDQGNTIEAFETPEETFEKVSNEVRVKLQSEKKSSKDGGILVDGILFDTDSEARISYIDFMIKLGQDPTYSVENWKASEGVWVTMDGELFIKLITTWEGHLKSIFNFVKEKEYEIEESESVEDLLDIDTKFE